MKNIFFLFIIFACTQCTSEKVPQNVFSGSWEYSSYSNVDSLKDKTFSINLEIQKDSIVGNYCSVTRGGSRIDCFDEKNKNIKGKVLNDTLYVTFFSSFNGEKGTAKLFFKNKKLIWTVNNFDGESLPTNIILEKKNN